MFVKSIPAMIDGIAKIRIRDAFQVILARGMELGTSDLWNGMGYSEVTHSHTHTDTPEHLLSLLPRPALKRGHLHSALPLSSTHR